MPPTADIVRMSERLFSISHSPVISSRKMASVSVRPGRVRNPPPIAFANAPRMDGSAGVPRAITSTVEAGCCASGRNSCGRGLPICVETRSAVTPTTV